jgi:tetratricopeptide (TPR) repeat protein
MELRRYLPLAFAAAAVVALFAFACPGFAQPVDKAERFESSFAHEASGDYAKSFADMQKILEQDPTDYVATLRAGWLTYLRKRYTESAAFYQQAVKLAPKAIEPQLGLMLPLMAAGRWADAERAGRAIVAKAPGDYLATSRLAFILFSQARFKEAEVLYRQVLDNYPSDTEMMLGLGWTWLRQGRKDEARQMFDAVLAIRRQNASAKAGRGAL